MALKIINYKPKMRNWDTYACQPKPNVNRKDLWELIETKPDFFQNADKYIKTGLEEEELYGRAHQTINLDLPRH